MKMMKKLFMFLCIVIMFFGIAGCPDNNELLPSGTTSNVVDSPQVGLGDNTSGGNGASAVPEPATLLLLGSGLVGLAVIVKKLKK